MNTVYLVFHNDYVVHVFKLEEDAATFCKENYYGGYYYEEWECE